MWTQLFHMSRWCEIVLHMSKSRQRVLFDSRQNKVFNSTGWDTVFIYKVITDTPCSGAVDWLCNLSSPWGSPWGCVAFDITPTFDVSPICQILSGDLISRLFSCQQNLTACIARSVRTCYISLPMQLEVCWWLSIIGGHLKANPVRVQWMCPNCIILFDWLQCYYKEPPFAHISEFPNFQISPSYRLVTKLTCTIYLSFGFQWLLVEINE